MSIKFNVINKRNPVNPEAPSKYYASSFITGKVGIEELTSRIEKLSTVSGADIRAVLYAIVDVVPEILSEGNSVTIGDLGSFRVSISSEGSDTAEEVTSANIRSSRIIFTPGKKFKTMLKTLTYSKA